MVPAFVLSFVLALPPAAPELPVELAAEALHLEPDFAPEVAGPSGDRLTVYLGQRSFDEDFWAPLEDQITVGIEFASERPENVLGWEVGLQYSWDDDEFGGFDVEASTLEVYGGVRKTFLDPEQALRPYLGAGLAWLTGDVEVSGVGSDDDDSLGIYLHGGLSARVSGSFSLGLDLRLLLGTDIDIAGISGDADYAQLALTAGWSL